MVSRFLTWKEQLILGSLAAAVLAGAVVLFIHARHDKDKELVQIPPQENSPARVEADQPVSPVAPMLPPMAETPFPPPPHPQTGVIVAEVKGAVKHPGVFDLAADARVEDLIDAAGGPTEDADLSDINRAARLIDGAPLIVPKFPRIALVDGVAVNQPEPTAAELNPPAYTVSGWRGGFTSAPPASGPASAEQHTPPGNPGLVDLNTATREQLEALPSIGPVTADKIIAYRNQTPFTRVEDLLEIRGIGPKTLDALRNCVTVNAP